MKKLILFSSLLISISAITIGQDNDNYSISSAQAGTINLNVTSKTIILNEDIQNQLKDQSLSASYYVIFTSIDNSILPSVTNKSNQSFSIIVNQNITVSKNLGTVDYIVFVKRKVIQLHNKSKPLLN